MSSRSDCSDSQELYMPALRFRLMVVKSMGMVITLEYPGACGRGEGKVGGQKWGPVVEG